MSSEKNYLKIKKVKFEDLGPKDDSSVDYPDYAHKVARKVKSSKSNVGIFCLLYTSPSPRD